MRVITDPARLTDEDKVGNYLAIIAERLAAIIPPRSRWRLQQTSKDKVNIDVKYTKTHADQRQRQRVRLISTAVGTPG